MESVEVHCTGDAALQLSFSDGRTDSISSEIVSRSAILSDLLASARGDDGDMMHVPRGYLQAWLEHVRSDMQAPPCETDIDSLLLLLKVGSRDVLLAPVVWILGGNSFSSLGHAHTSARAVVEPLCR